MKAKLGRVLYVAHACVAVHLHILLRAKKGCACAEEIQDLFKKRRVAFIFKREIGLCNAKCGFPFISA